MVLLYFLLLVLSNPFERSVRLQKVAVVLYRKIRIKGFE